MGPSVCLSVCRSVNLCLASKRPLLLLPTHSVADPNTFQIFCVFFLHFCGTLFLTTLYHLTFWEITQPECIKLKKQSFKLYQICDWMRLSTSIHLEMASDWTCPNKKWQKKKKTFLDATTHLYKRSCPSVGPSVGPSVRRSVRPVLFSKDENREFWG